MLDNDKATFEELRVHLKSIAQSFLCDKAEDFWSGVEVDHLSDAKSDLREIAATQPLNEDQHKVIIEALSVLSAAQDRVLKGDAKPLLESLRGLAGVPAAASMVRAIESTAITKEDNVSPTGVSAGGSTSILNNDVGTTTPEVTQSRHEGVTFGVLVSDLLTEKMMTLKPASMRDLESTLRTVAKHVPESGMDLMSRVAWLSVNRP